MCQMYRHRYIGQMSCASFTVVTESAFGMGFLSGMVNYLVLLWDGRPIRDAVMSVITSLLLPGFFIHTAYLGRLEYAEELKYEDIGDDKDKDV